MAGTLRAFAGLASLVSVGLGQYAFTGSDNFDDNSLTIGAGQRWVASTGTGTGAFAETGQRLEYTGMTSGGVAGRRLLVWYDSTLGNNSFAEDWQASVVATNLSSALTTFTEIGIEVFKAGADSGYFGLYLYRDSGSDYMIYAENRSFNGSSYVQVGAPWGLVAATSVDVELQLSWSATARLLTAGYRFDSVSSFTTLNIGTPAQIDPAATWSTSPSTGFGLRLAGHSSLDDIPAATLSLDEMKVATAVPEPAALALAMGLGALGCAAWLRRNLSSRRLP
ncbi:MAG TPA: hypothetical protein VG936_16470 [Lacunisphaera sp.]|nr:hypothetical protein [Lacunisphaera sp.]